MTPQKGYNPTYLTKLSYVLKRKGASDDIKLFCVLELMHWHELVLDDAYKYLGLSRELLEEKFNNITNTNKKEK